MTEFLQLHLLTSYPPANLNRDDLGRPKTAVMGGVQRLRVSSQSLKRAWRTSELFREALAEHTGVRTRELGPRRVLVPMTEAGVSEKIAKKAAEAIAQVFAKLDKKKSPQTGQLVHLSPEEIAAVDQLVQVLIAEKRAPNDDELKLLSKEHRAVDIALFGRMLADHVDYNVEAAAQIAHAITVHQVTIEDDYFTAVDDLNDGREDAGAAHVGEGEFAAGLFYLYACIDRDRLLDNLQGDVVLTGKTLRALTEAACKVAPSGKQNSFASRAYASYVLAERGDQQPRSMSAAFLAPVRDEKSYLPAAIEKLEALLEQFDNCYGATARSRYTLDVSSEKGTFAELLDFVASDDGGDTP